MLFKMFFLVLFLIPKFEQDLGYPLPERYWIWFSSKEMVDIHGGVTDGVPPNVSELWWSDKFIVATVFPYMDEGFDYETNRSRCDVTYSKRWYIINVETCKRQEYKNQADFEIALKKVGIDPRTLKMIDPQKGKALRETQLGLKLDSQEVRRQRRLDDDFEQYESAISNFFYNKNRCPNNLNELRESGLYDGKMKDVLPKTDPWGHDFGYNLSGGDNRYSFWSEGPQGANKIYMPKRIIRKLK